MLARYKVAGAMPEHYRSLGFVAFISSRLRSRATAPLINLREWIEPAALLNQIEFAFDRNGRPCGYFTWAYLAPDVEQLIFDADLPLLHISEWREGANIWVVDFVALPGTVRVLAQQVVQKFFPNFRDFRYIKRDASGAKRDVRRIAFSERGARLERISGSDAISE